MGEFNRKPNTNCGVCGTPIYRRPAELERSKGKSYCSSVCYGKASRKETPCVICGTPIMAHKNKRTCSRACSNKSRVGTIYTGRRLRDNVVSTRRLRVRLFALRGSICERCNYSVHQVLQIHHKDRNRQHNDLDNLEIICPNCHAFEHYVKK
jgi:hypothetical protein